MLTRWAVHLLPSHCRKPFTSKAHGKISLKHVTAIEAPTKTEGMYRGNVRYWEQASAQDLSLNKHRGSCLYVVCVKHATDSAGSFNYCIVTAFDCCMVTVANGAAGWQSRTIVLRTAWTSYEICAPTVDQMVMWLCRLRYVACWKDS
jgi:hypothetical protein